MNQKDGVIVYRSPKKTTIDSSREHMLEFEDL